MLNFFISHLPAMIVFVLFALTVIAARRNLPAQNIVAIVIFIAIMSSLIEILGAKTGIPFGSFFYTENLGALVFRLMPWPIPLIWVVMLLNSHEVARLILRRWRGTAHYGYWSLGLSCLLAMFFDVSLEPVARALHFWFWRTSPKIPAWYGAPWINFAAWAAVSLLILGIILPWLLDKKMSNEPRIDHFPLNIWLFMMFLLATVNAFHTYWAAALLGFAGSAVIAFLARRNSRIGVPISD